MRNQPFGALAVIACVTLWTWNCVSPDYDASFGASVRIAQARQTLNPNASKDTRVMTRLEGDAAKNALDRYYESFKTPPPSTGFTLNIGTFGSGGGAGGK